MRKRSNQQKWHVYTINLRHHGVAIPLYAGRSKVVEERFWAHRRGAILGKNRLGRAILSFNRRYQTTHTNADLELAVVASFNDYRAAKVEGSVA